MGERVDECAPAGPGPGACRRACPACGSAFRCGVAAGDAACWCFNRPAVGSVAGVPADLCVCPACLDLVANPKYSLGSNRGELDTQSHLKT